MKTIVLYIGSMQKGGAQRVMSVLAKHLSGQGHHIIMINDIRPIANIPEYYLPNTITRIYLDETEKSGITRNLSRIIKLEKTLKDFNPDCVLSFEGPPNIRLLVASIGLKCKTIVSVRNDPVREYGTGIKGFLLKQVFRFASMTIFQTEKASFFFPYSVRTRSVVIPNPIDGKFFQESWTGKGRDIIAVGRLQPQKNYPLLIEAFAKIAPRFPDTDLVICGDGVLRRELEALVEQYGIKDRVHFRGIVEDVRNELKRAGVFVMSSDYEGMPNALMEAMAVGVPIISTDCPCGGPSELLGNGKYGVLVNCGNVLDLACSMEKLLASDTDRQYYHNMSLQRSKKYQTDIIMEKWLNILEN